jgi:hypothetical protein
LHHNMKSSSLKCLKCENDEFELRVLRDEAVASSRCLKCSENYLLLDSGDYWFDVIQKGYPRLTRCSCKSESFRLRIDYNFRDDGDINYIEVQSICSGCGKSRRQLEIDIKYGGTDHLFKRPLVPCKNPKILYDLKDISLLITLSDMERIVDYLADIAQCNFISRALRQDIWVSVQQDAAGAKATIEQGKYLFIYAMPGQVEVPEDQVNTIEKEDVFWKRSEVIRISSKYHVCIHRLGNNPPYICYCSDIPTDGSYTELGLSFFINFSNEIVRAENIVSKSESFRKVTASLLAMLQGEFVCWRGPHCFDNPEVNVRIFDDRFREGQAEEKC